MQEPLSALVQRYEEVLAHSSFTSSSRKQYRSHVCTFVRWLSSTSNSNALVDQKGAEQAANAYSDYLRRDLLLEPGSVNSILTCVNHFFRCVRSWQVSLPRWHAPRKAVRTLTEAEMLRLTVVLLVENVSIRDRSLCVLLLLTGLRIGECSDLDLCDIDLKEENPHVLAGRKPQRLVPLNATVVDYLSRWLTVRPKTAATTLFTASNGNCMSADSIDQIVRKVGRMAHLDISCQTLRNTCIARLMRRGFDSMVVAELTGADPVTLKAYRQPTVFESRSVMASLVLPDAHSQGTVNQKVLPMLCEASIPMLPPCNSTISFARANPRPELLPSLLLE